jgi:hypothetical protein
MIVGSDPKSLEQLIGTSAVPSPNSAPVDPSVAQDQYEPPPPYTHAGAPPSAQATGATGKPTNYLSLSRAHQPITGIYTIDPRVKIPRALLPPLAPESDETEATRKNVSLHTTTGAIDVDLFVVGQGKVDMRAETASGGIRIGVVCLFFSPKCEIRR